MEVKPLGARVLARLIPKPGQTATGVITPTDGDDGPATLKILAIGDGVRRVEVGQVGFASKFAGMNVDMSGMVRLLLEEEIVAVIYPDEWTIHLLPYGTSDLKAGIVTPIQAAPTAIVRLDPEAGVVLSPMGTPLPEEERKALNGHEFVRVVAEKVNEDGGRDLIVLFKVRADALLKTPGEFTARAIKDETGWGRWERIPVDGGAYTYASATSPDDAAQASR